MYVSARCAGWYPGRRVPLPANLPALTPEGEQILREWQWLCIRGDRLAYVDIFYNLALHAQHPISAEILRDLRLCSIGQTIWGCDLFVNSQGVVYYYSGESLVPIGAGLVQALRFLLFGDSISGVDHAKTYDFPMGWDSLRERPSST